MVHRGKILKEELEKFKDQSGLSLVAISKLVGYDQSTLYRQFEKEDLPIHIIFKYAQKLEHDFTQSFPELLESEYSNKASVKKSNEVENKEAEFWKDKYIDILEKHNILLEEKINWKS